MDSVIFGDCVDTMRDMDNSIIDLTVTSPPYDNLREYNGKIETWSEQKWRDVIAELYRITKDGGVVVWVVADATVNGSETGTSFRQALHAIDCGFNLHDTMIWTKPGFSAVGSLAVRYAPVFEYMFVLSKGPPRVFNPIKDRACSTHGSVNSGTIRNPDGTMKRMSTEGRVQPAYGQRYNVWEIAPETRGADHPAPFPSALVRDHIHTWTNEGDLVFDPFTGSGTTGIVAKSMGRHFIGCEIDETYHAFAKSRIDATAFQPGLFG